MAASHPTIGPRVLVMSRAILKMLRLPPGEFDYVCLDDHADRDRYLAEHALEDLPLNSELQTA